MTVEVRSRGVSLILIIIAILLFLLDAFGVGGKIGIGFLPLGLAFFAGSFVF